MVIKKDELLSGRDPRQLFCKDGLFEGVLTAVASGVAKEAGGV